MSTSRSVCGLGFLLVALSLASPSARATGSDDAKTIEYLERSYKCTSADEWYQLAQWCKENGLADRVERNLRRAIRWDPDHAQARADLGFILYDGPPDNDQRRRWREKKWLDGVEAEAARKDLADLSAKAESDKAARDADPYLSQCDRLLAEYKADPYFQGLKIPWDYSARRDILESNRPYVIVVQEGRDFHYHQIGEVLQQYIAAFMRDYAGPFGLKAIDTPLLVVALKDQDAYDDYCSRHGQPPSKVRAAHYEPKTRRVICHGDPQQGTSNPFRPVIDGGTFTHEATHQLIDYFTRVRTGGVSWSQSHWFQEGVAEYIGNLHRVDQTREGKGSLYFFGRFAGDRADEFRERRLGKKPVFDLKELLHIGSTVELEAVTKQKDPEDWQRMTSLFYAEAWTLIRFFKQDTGETQYGKKFDQYFSEELSGHTGFDVFENIFQIKDYAELEKQWLAYVEKTT
ncbi:MAG: hypothetical protein HYR85_18140 [Planctomycetes bacterium]|nr:hypothetical protein [Planctomycetota bacterium]MBI3843215.1 hypothetical protein [Planctomycetota bacterium]